MFTGLVAHCGVIQALSMQPDGMTVTIETTFSDLEIGESIAVDGVCLTVAETTPFNFVVNVSRETLAVTNLSRLVMGGKVNLERSLRVSDRCGGHFVLGHVDAVLWVQSIERQGEFISMGFTGVSAEAVAYCVKKGSLSINGVSLTINQILLSGVEVMLIPHTLQRTNLGLLQTRDQVNVEYDYLAKVVVGQLNILMRSRDEQPII